MNPKEKKDQRNLYIRIPEDQKVELKRLAKESSMTLEVYAAAILEEAIKSGELFEFVRVRHDRKPVLPS